MERAAPRRAEAVAVLMLAGVVGLAGCRSAAENDAAAVLATFDGGEVTLGELEREGDSRARGAAATIEKIALREILAAAAEPVPGEAAAAEAVYEAAMRERLGWSDPALGEADLRAYYESHREDFAQPERLRLQHVFVRAEAGSASEGERAAARERIDALRRRALNGAGFGDLARRHSDSADGPTGGWMVLERDTPAVRAFVDVVWALDEDEVSPVIETPVGFHLARVATRIAARELPYEDVREQVAREALAARVQQLEDEFIRLAGPKHDLQRRYELLARTAATEETSLFSLAGEAFTVADLLRTIPDTYRSHFYAGYFPRVRQALDREILRRLLVLEAAAAGLDREPAVQAEVAAAIADMRAAAELERRLAERLETVDPEELRRHYRRAPSRYRTPRRRSISVIRLAPDETDSLWSLLRRGEELVEALRAGEEFESLAARESSDRSAAAGGRVPDLQDDELAVRVPSRSRGRRMVDELDVGEISPAFIGEVYDPDSGRMVPTGVYVVRLDEEIPSRRRSFEEAKELVRAEYIRRHAERATAELEHEILARAGFRRVEG